MQYLSKKKKRVVFHVINKKKGFDYMIKLKTIHKVGAESTLIHGLEKEK